MNKATRLVFEEFFHKTEDTLLIDEDGIRSVLSQMHFELTLSKTFSTSILKSRYHLSKLDLDTGLII